MDSNMISNRTQAETRQHHQAKDISQQHQSKNEKQSLRNPNVANRVHSPFKYGSSKVSRVRLPPQPSLELDQFHHSFNFNSPTLENNRVAMVPDGANHSNPDHR